MIPIYRIINTLNCWFRCTSGCGQYCIAVTRFDHLDHMCEIYLCDECCGEFEAECYIFHVIGRNEIEFYNLHILPSYGIITHEFHNQKI